MEDLLHMKMKLDVHIRCDEIMKNKPIIVAITIILILSFSGCATRVWNDEISLECEATNNTLNTIKAGGDVAYTDGKLYISLEKKLYEISNGKRKQIDTDSLNIDNKPYGATANYFNFNNELYAIPISDDNHILMKYDSEKNEFTESELKINPHYGEFYLSDNLCVWRGHNWYDTYVRYNGEEYKVDNNTERISVYNDLVYYTTDSGELYSFNPCNISKKSQFIKKLENGYVHEIYVIDDYCYYLGTGGIYSYSFDSDKTELITDNNVYNFSVVSDKLYISTEENGLYYVEDNQMKKVCNISMSCIYSFDKEYLYTYNSYGNIYRINTSNSKVEPIVETKKLN